MLQQMILNTPSSITFNFFIIINHIKLVCLSVFSHLIFLSLSLPQREIILATADEKMYNMHFGPSYSSFPVGGGRDGRTRQWVGEAVSWTRRSVTAAGRYFHGWLSRAPLPRGRVYSPCLSLLPRLSPPPLTLPPQPLLLTSSFRRCHRTLTPAEDLKVCRWC